MLGNSWIITILISIFSIIMVGGGSEVFAQCVPDPLADDGPRSCDSDDPGSGCPLLEAEASGVIGDWVADFNTYRETLPYLATLDADVDGVAGDFMSFVFLGTSPGLDVQIDSNPGAPVSDYTGVMYAVRVTEGASDQSIQKPAVLLICGVHAHEWIPQETCLGVVDYLVKAANAFPPYDTIADLPTILRVRELLQEREVWAVVNANPSGRMHDDELSYNGWYLGKRDKRKNDQWSSDFDCELNGLEQSQAGASGENVNYPSGARRDWLRVGINLDTVFSSRWGDKSVKKYLRNMILGDLGLPEVAPQEFNCYDFDQISMNQNCINTFGSAYGHCLLYFKNGIERYGCFLAQSQPDDAAGLAACENYSPTGDGFIPGTPGCLRTEINDVGGREYFLWECGPSGADEEDVRGASAGDPILWYDNDNPGLLQFCHRGLLQSCSEDADCQVTDVLGNSLYDVTISGYKHAPHYMPVADMPDHLFCSNRQCSVDARRSCGSGTYGGRWPFEAVESRLIRELVNNYPFSIVVDMHASAGILNAVCQESELANGCGTWWDGSWGWVTDRAGQNMSDMMSQAADLFYDGAEQHWDTYYKEEFVLPGGIIVQVQFPEFLGLRSNHSLNLTSGRPPIWTAVQTQHQGTGTTLSRTKENFDLGTSRAIPSIEWEMGSPGTAYMNENLPDEIPLLEKVSRCAMNEGGGCKPRSRAMVENQLAGARALVEYLADQAEIPNTATDAAGSLPVSRHDLALIGLRIHDTEGRGVQQTEVRWDEIQNDPNAEIVVPAGRWLVSFDYIAGGDPLDSIEGTLNLSFQSEPGPSVIDKPVDGLHVELETGNRETVTIPYEFLSGRTYTIRAENSFGIDPNINDSLANDLLISKVKVIPCDYEDYIPNGLDRDAFCQKGLPFENYRFECWDSDNPFGYATCRECWSDAFDEQGCDGYGGFCFEGLCDDSEVCWSGHLEDVYEEEGGGESPVRVYNDGTGTDTVVRSLYRTPDSTSGQVQDVDSLYVLPEPPVHPHARYLAVRVRNHCSFGKHLDEPMEEVEVKVQQLASELPLAPYESASYQDITDWEHPLRISGIVLPLSDEELAAFAGGYPLRVQVRNGGTPLEEFSYTLEATMSPLDLVFEPDDYIPVPKPGESLVWPMGVVSLSATTGEAAFVSPSGSAMETGGWLHFDPSDEVDVGAVSFVLRDSRGEVAMDEWGQTVGEAVPRHGGLAIPLDDLSPRYAPYRGTLVGLRGEVVVGRVLLCPEGTNDCSAYEPTRDICGAQEGEVCCVDDNGGYFALDPDGDDPDNCGACGLACGWDELCLEGTCVEGLSTRCWNTDCPDGTFCISDGWFGADPRCEAILVDREHCGWFEDVCEPSEQCQFGFCLPRLYGDCDAVCGEDEACCWKGGVETCVDVEEGLFDCGACGNVCDVGEVCSGGMCMQWYTVLDPCPFDLVNCGTNGEIDCVNLDSDDDHCGSCLIGCTQDAECVDGACLAPTMVDEHGEEL